MKKLLENELEDVAVTTVEGEMKMDTKYEMSLTPLFNENGRRGG